MSTRILRRPLLTDPEALPPQLPALLRRIYAARNVVDPRELDKGLAALAPPTALKGLASAVELLAKALAQDKRILVVADYDADGATSCALALRALEALGGRDLHYLVPNRFEYGYGLTPEIVELAAAKHPDLLITVDNGISSLAGVAAARARGMQVLVTDHHLAGARLPEADAIVNPNQPGCAFPGKNLAGVGVIFYVLSALRARLRAEGWFRRRGIPEPAMGRFLDLVALGTVADVVPLDHINRILVEQGLRRIRAGQCLPGITALARIAGRNPQRLGAVDLGFALGPRLNAAGRLTDMGFGIDCLLCDDPLETERMAGRLDSLNRERRGIEARMQTQALADLERLDLAGSGLPFGLCLYDPDWHQGVIGILAARVRERTHRPTIAFAPDQAGVIKGSARSVPGLHIRDALDAVAARHPDLLHKFGGHAMAAGMSLTLDRFQDFSQAFDAEVRRHLDAADLCGKLYSDGVLAPADCTLAMAEQLQEAGPWGQGFPAPLFDGLFQVAACRVLKDKHLKLHLLPDSGGAALEAIGFNLAERLGEPAVGSRWRAAYRLDVNEWRGERRLQLVLEHLEPA